MTSGKTKPNLLWPIRPDFIHIPIPLPYSCIHRVSIVKEKNRTTDNFSQLFVALSIFLQQKCAREKKNQKIYGKSSKRNLAKNVSLIAQGAHGTSFNKEKADHRVIRTEGQNPSTKATTAT
jgi:hypothetical protein